MPGVELSEAGRSQAAALAEALAARPIAAVVTSPLERAQQTAVPIAARLGLVPLIDPGLNEIDFGHWTGLAFAELAGRPEWDAWNRARSFAACPGGESMVAAQARALATIGVLRAGYPEAELVLVSHQDVLKSVLAHFLGVPLDLFGRFAWDPAHRSVLQLGAAEVFITGVNVPP